MTYRVPPTVAALLERYRRRIKELEEQIAQLGSRVAQLEAELRALREGEERPPEEGSPPQARGPESDCERELERLRKTVEELTKQVERLSGVDLTEAERRLLQYLHATGGWFDLEEASRELNLPPETVMAAARSLASKGALILVEGGA